MVKSDLPWEKPIEPVQYKPGHSISYKIECVPSKDSDGPVPRRRLIRVFVVHLKRHCEYSVETERMRRLR